MLSSHGVSFSQVKLPAEQEDFLKRPAYIKNNDAGVPICENRYTLSSCLRLLFGSNISRRPGAHQVTVPCLEGGYTPQRVSVWMICQLDSLIMASPR